MITSDAGRAVDSAFLKLAQRIREEFEEAPGLRITVIEASRFWGLDEETCGRVLARLLAAGFLRQSLDSRYGRA